MRPNDAECSAQKLAYLSISGDVGFPRLLAYFCFGREVGAFNKYQDRTSLIRNTEQFNNFLTRSLELDSPHIKLILNLWRIL